MRAPYAVKIARWGGLRLEPYKPNAVDADGDMIVQEQTIWERPVGTRMLDGLGREISPSMPSSVDPSARGKDWRIVDADGKDVTYTPTWEREGFVPDVTGPAGPPVGGTPRSIADRGARTVGDYSTTVGDQAEARAQALAGADRRGKPLSHDEFVPLTDEEREAGLEGVAGAREALARSVDTELTGGVPDPAAEGTANEDIVWDEAGRKWVDLTYEEREYLRDEMIEAMADGILAEMEEAGDDGELKEPTGEESRNLRGIREKYPRLQKLRQKAHTLLTLGRQASSADIPDGLGTARLSDGGFLGFPITPTPAEKEKAVSKDFFYKMFYLAKSLWGGSEIGDAEEVLRDGIDDPETGRRIVFVGKEPDLSADSMGDKHLLVLDGAVPMVGGNWKSTADYYEGVFLPSKDASEARRSEPGNRVKDGRVLVPDLDVEMDLDDSDADVPMELLYLAIQKRLEEEGSQRGQDAAILELAKEVKSVGVLFRAEVSKRVGKAKRARGPARESRLSEFFGRTPSERIDMATVEAHELSEHARRTLGFDADHFDYLHIDQPVVARVLNEAMRRAVIRVLGYEPEWTRRDRSDPADPEATLEQSAARARADVPGGAPDWETEDAAWNGSPEYLFKGLIRELAEQYEADPDMTEEEFLEKLENLDDEIVAAFEEELKIEVRARPKTFWSELSLAELESMRGVLFDRPDTLEAVPGEIGDTLDGLEDRMGYRRMDRAARKISMDSRVRVGRITEGEAATTLAFLVGREEEEYLRQFLEELEFKRMWMGFDPVLGRVFKEAELTGGTWFEIGYRSALADATRMDGPDGRVGVLQALREAGRLDSVVTSQNERQIAIELLRELLEHGGIEEVRAALRDGREGSEERLAELVEREATGVLLPAERRELRFLKLKTPEERAAIFDHVQSVLERSGKQDDLDGISETLLNRIETRASVSSPRTDMTPDSDDHIVYNENLEQLERITTSALRFMPLRLIKRLGLMGPIGIQTTQPTTVAGRRIFKPVIRAGQRWAQAHDGGYQATRPFGGTVTHLPATTDLPTALHEITHSLALSDPVINGLLSAYVAMATGTEEDGLRGWNNRIKKMSEASPRRGRGISGAAEGTTEFFVDIEDHDGFVYSHRVYPDMTDPYIRENISKLIRPNGSLDVEKVANFYDEYHTYDEGRIRFVPSELITVAMEQLLTPDAYATLDMWDGTDASLIEYIFGLLLTVG